MRWDAQHPRGTAGRSPTGDVPLTQPSNSVSVRVIPPEDGPLLSIPGSADVVSRGDGPTGPQRALLSAAYAIDASVNIVRSTLERAGVDVSAVPVSDLSVIHTLFWDPPRDVDVVNLADDCLTAAIAAGDQIREVVDLPLLAEMNTPALNEALFALGLTDADQVQHSHGIVDLSPLTNQLLGSEHAAFLPPMHKATSALHRTFAAQVPGIALGQQQRLEVLQRGIAAAVRTDARPLIEAAVAPLKTDDPFRCMVQTAFLAPRDASNAVAKSANEAPVAAGADLTTVPLIETARQMNKAEIPAAVPATVGAPDSISDADTAKALKLVGLQASLGDVRGVQQSGTPAHQAVQRASMGDEEQRVHATLDTILATPEGPKIFDSLAAGMAPPGPDGVETPTLGYRQLDERVAQLRSPVEPDSFVQGARPHVAPVLKIDEPLGMELPPHDLRTPEVIDLVELDDVDTVSKTPMDGPGTW